ncbi:TIR domain-containing protein [candidate division KSB1 bacterium]|nr:TIR domain-containing protein [candidate division KSB1 bacterium]
MPQTNQPKIFISHAWQDKPLVRRLEKELQAAGAEVWVDHEGIRGGDNLPERISDALKWCNTLLLLWSKAASTSDWVEMEWSNAVSLKKAIIPCRLDNTELPAILAHKAWVGFSDVETGLAQLLQALRLIKPAPPTQTPQAAEPPARVIHSPLQEALQSTPIVKPSCNDVLRLRSTPARLSNAEVKAMLRKHDFYCSNHDWNSEWSNPQGKGIAHKYELQRGGQVVTDYHTDLMWQQGGSTRSLSLVHAGEYVRALNAIRFAGYCDWRLPTLEEAMSLMEAKARIGEFDRTQLWIWTADEIELRRASWRWVVDFNFSQCNHCRVGTYYWVRAVRSGQSSI